jgi:hypothetical protein
MSDVNQTPRRTSRPTPDSLDAMGQELLTLARTGLVPSRIIERQAAHGGLSLLLEFASQSSERRKRAEDLISLVVEACNDLGPGGLGQSARKLYGIGLGEREFPYERRHANAAESWNPDIEVSSWDRRHRREVITELEYKMLSLKREAEQAKLRDTLAQNYLPPLVDPRNDRPNADFERLEFRAETHIVGTERRPFFTDWKYRDIAIRGGQQYHRVFTQMEARVTIESRCDFVEVEQELGVNRYGYQIWLIRFVDPPKRGDIYEWSIRKRFSGELPEEVDKGWLSLAVSQPKNIERGTFVVNLEEAEERPKRFARFITPKMTLPTLRGPIWPLPESDELCKTIAFEYLTPWQSHGIYWWWE